MAYQNTTLLRSEDLANLAHGIVLTHVDLAVLHLHGETQFLELAHHAMFERHLALGDHEGLGRLETGTSIVKGLEILEEGSHLLSRTVGEEQTAVSAEQFAEFAQIVAILLLL